MQLRRNPQELAEPKSIGLIVMRSLSLWVLIFVPCLLTGKEKSYQTGIPLDVSDARTDIGVGPSHVGFLVRVRSDDRIYSLLSTKRPEELGWTLGGSLQFRIEGNKAFARRPDGKEWAMAIRHVERGAAFSGTSGDVPSAPEGLTYFPLLDGALPLQSGLRLGMLPMGINFLNSEDSCALFSANLSSYDFFRKIKIGKTQIGKDFRIDSRKIARFPDRMTARIVVGVWPCSSSERASNVTLSLQPTFRFTREFIQSLSFEGFWKHGLESKRADVTVLTGAQAPLTAIKGGTCFEYQLEIKSQDAPVSDSLVISVFSSEGKLITRFSGSL